MNANKESAMGRIDVAVEVSVLRLANNTQAADALELLAAERKCWVKMCESHDHFGMIQSNPSLAFVLTPEDRTKLLARVKADRKAWEDARAATDARLNLENP